MRHFNIEFDGVLIAILIRSKERERERKRKEIRSFHEMIKLFSTDVIALTSFIVYLDEFSVLRFAAYKSIIICSKTTKL